MDCLARCEWFEQNIDAHGRFFWGGGDLGKQNSDSAELLVVGVLLGKSVHDRRPCVEGVYHGRQLSYKHKQVPSCGLLYFQCIPHQSTRHNEMLSPLSVCMVRGTAFTEDAMQSIFFWLRGC